MITVSWPAKHVMMRLADQPNAIFKGALNKKCCAAGPRFIYNYLLKAQLYVCGAGHRKVECNEMLTSISPFLLCPSELLFRALLWGLAEMRCDALCRATLSQVFACGIPGGSAYMSWLWYLDRPLMQGPSTPNQVSEDPFGLYGPCLLHQCYHCAPTWIFCAVRVVTLQQPCSRQAQDAPASLENLLHIQGAAQPWRPALSLGLKAPVFDRPLFVQGIRLWNHLLAVACHEWLFLQSYTRLVVVGLLSKRMSRSFGALSFWALALKWIACQQHSLHCSWLWSLTRYAVLMNSDIFSDILSGVLAQEPSSSKLCCSVLMLELLRLDEFVPSRYMSVAFRHTCFNR